MLGCALCLNRAIANRDGVPLSRRAEGFDDAEGEHCRALQPPCPHHRVCCRVERRPQGTLMLNQRCFDVEFGLQPQEGKTKKRKVGVRSQQGARAHSCTIHVSQQRPGKKKDDSDSDVRVLRGRLSCSLPFVCCRAMRIWLLRRAPCCRRLGTMVCCWFESGPNSTVFPATARPARPKALRRSTLALAWSLPRLMVSCVRVVAR